MSLTRCSSADELDVLQSAADSRAAQAGPRCAVQPRGSTSTVAMLEQLQAELAEFLAETKVRLERACERTSEGAADRACQPEEVGVSECQPATRQLADESFDRLQEIKRRLAAQLQQ